MKPAARLLWIAVPFGVLLQSLSTQAASISFDSVDAEVHAVIGNQFTCDSGSALGGPATGFLITASASCPDFLADAELSHGALTATGYSVAGTASAFAPQSASGLGQVQAQGRATSSVLVTVTETTILELDFSWVVNFNVSGNGSSTVSLGVDPGPFQPNVYTFTRSGSQNGREIAQVTLAPGDYTIVADAFMNGAGRIGSLNSGQANGGFELAVTVVPESSTLVLLALGLVVLRYRA